MASKLVSDPRIDPRIKAMMGAMDMQPARDAKNREEMLAAENTPAAKAQLEAQRGMFDMMDNETVAPSAGLRVTEESFRSEPDGNTIKVQYIRPDTDETLACVAYVHGGGMMTMSCFDGMYRAWGRIIAA